MTIFDRNDVTKTAATSGFLFSELRGKIQPPVDALSLALPMDIARIALSRHTCKAYDPSKKISADKIEQITS